MKNRLPKTTTGTHPRISPKIPKDRGHTTPPEWVTIEAIIRGESTDAYRVCRDLKDAQSPSGGTWVSKCDIQRGKYVKDGGRFDKMQSLALPKSLAEKLGYLRAETKLVLPSTVISFDDLKAFDQLVIEHDGNASWMDLQTVKNAVWGADVLAIEIYPPQSQVVNGNSTEFHFRHLWRFPVWMNWPNIRGEDV